MSEYDSTTPAEPENTETPPMPYETYRDKPILAQLAAFEGIVGRAEYEVTEVKEMVEEGADESWGAFTLTVAGREKATLSAALHLVGFFSEELGQVAKSMFERMIETNHEALDAITDEQRDALRAAADRVEAKRIATMFGVPAEEVESFVNSFGERGMDALDDVVPTEIEQGEWQRTAGEDSAA